MRSTVTSRSGSARVLTWAPPRGLVTGAIPTEHHSSSGGGPGKKGARGLYVQATYALIDVLFVSAGGIAIFLLRFGLLHRVRITSQLFHSTPAHAYLGFFLLYAALVVLSCISQNLYRTPRDRSIFDETWMVLKAVAVATALLALFIFTSGNKEISRLVIWSSGVFSALALSGWRAAKRRLVIKRTEAGINVARVLIVGAGRVGRSLAQWLDDNPQFGYTVCGFLDSRTSADPRVLGSVRDLRTIALAQFVDELFITLPADRKLVKHLVLQARLLKLNLKVVPELYDGLGWHAPLHSLGGFPLMELCRQPIPVLGLAVKRAMDIALASLALILVAPVLALLALLIRLDSPGPVFYVAERVGRKGVKFRCFKLRTMVAGADEQKEELRNANERNGPFFKMENDPRVTPLGRWLRKLSLDEIPQLWNVLFGDMSLVGPRPHPVDDYERYDIEHLRRLDVKPGVTGLWQVTARRDPSFDTNMALDLEYIENWSLWLDLKIALRTLPAVLRAQGN
ncbi:MAG TPA: sugar transferase [Candidatus Acidoferrum sp.]|nr:sugar transferase [Candidatus Acidoferrum sp.]